MRSGAIVAGGAMASPLWAAYFDDLGELNARDGIYRQLTKPQQKSVTVEFGKTTDSPDVPVGDFTIVMGPRKAARTTPPM